MIPAIIQLPLSAGYILAGLLSCDTQAAPAVQLHFENKPVQIDNTKSSRELAGLKERSISPHYGGEFPILGGITDGSFQVKHSIGFTNTLRSLLRNACVWAEDITITITYAATVYVSSGYPPGSCHYDLMRDHEMLHVATDIAVLREFLPYIEEMTVLSVSSWRGAGPVPQDQLQSTQDNLSQQLSDILGGITDTLQRDRTVRQHKVDSREEYRRLSEACPDEPDL